MGLSLAVGEVTVVFWRRIRMMHSGVLCVQLFEGKLGIERRDEIETSIQGNSGNVRGNSGKLTINFTFACADATWPDRTPVHTRDRFPIIEPHAPLYPHADACDQPGLRPP